MSSDDNHTGGSKRKKFVSLDIVAGAKRASKLADPGVGVVPELGLIHLLGDHEELVF